MMLAFPVAILLLVSCTEAGAESPLKPRAIRGVMDLTGWNFLKNGPIHLDGEWEFYWRKLLSPSDFKNAANLIPAIVEVPANWNGYHTESKNGYPGDGYATYHMVVKSLPRSKLGVKLNYFLSSYRLYVNGNLVASNGIVNAEKKGSKAQYLPMTAFFETDGGDLEVILQVSNFEHAKGGFVRPALLGLQEQIRQERERLFALDILLFGILLTIAMFFLTGAYYA